MLQQTSNARYYEVPIAYMVCKPWQTGLVVILVSIGKRILAAASHLLLYLSHLPGTTTLWSLQRRCVWGLEAAKTLSHTRYCRP